VSVSVSVFVQSLDRRAFSVASVSEVDDDFLLVVAVEEHFIAVPHAATHGAADGFECFVDWVPDLDRSCAWRELTWVVLVSFAPQVLDGDGVDVVVPAEFEGRWAFVAGVGCPDEFWAAFPCHVVFSWAVVCVWCLDHGPSRSRVAFPSVEVVEMSFDHRSVTELFAEEDEAVRTESAQPFVQPEQLQCTVSKKKTKIPLLTC